MPGVNLEPMRRVVDKEMVDACIITRDVDQHNDDTYDPSTMQYLAPNDDVETIYEGKCFFSAFAQVPRDEVQAMQEVTQSIYKLRIPWDAPELLPEDDVRITACQRDTEAVGLELIVSEVDITTFNVMRIARCRRNQHRVYQ